MQNSALAKLLAALTVLIIVLAVALHFLNRNALNSSVLIPSPTNPIAENTFHFHALPVPRPQPPEPDAAGFPKIPREKVEEWLAKHNRDAASLLAAFRALGDTNYLNEAATNFPNNPQVELAVLAHDEFPQDRRKWLDLFKASSPSNSLANYLSAQNYFENGNPTAGIQELQAANGKLQFDAFLTQSRLDEEDLYSSSGYSQLDSDRESSYGMFQEYNSGELQTFDHLGVEMGDLQKQYLDSGNANSAASVAQMGMTFANQLNNGDSGKYFINQLVGMAIENEILSQLDQNTSYDFLDGQTPDQILAQNKEQKTAFRELRQNFEADYPNLTPDEMAGYWEREKSTAKFPPRNGSFSSIRKTIRENKKRGRIDLAFV